MKNFSISYQVFFIIYYSFKQDKTENKNKLQLFFKSQIGHHTTK